MVDAIQVQRRRGTTAQCEGMVPAEGEIIVDLTKDRIRLGDGLMAGGHILPNARAIQKSAFISAVAGGTANALTANLEFPITGYEEFINILLRATNTNNGASTLNVDGNGDESISKITEDGIVALEGGEIVTDGIYHIIYGASGFILLNPSTAPNLGNAPLNTFNISSPVNNVDFVLPSGYCEFKLIYESVTIESSGFGSDKYLSLRASSDGGSTFYAGASDYDFSNIKRSRNSTSLTIDAGDEEAEIILGKTLGGFSATTTYSGYISLINMGSSDNNKMVRGESLNSDSNRTFYTTMGMIDKTASINAIRIKPNSTKNMTAGNFYLHGTRSS